MAKNTLLMSVVSSSGPFFFFFLFFSKSWNKHQDLVLNTLTRVKVYLPIRANDAFSCLFEANAIISIWINPSHTSYKICVRCMWTHAYFAGSNRLTVMVSRPPASSLLAGMETALSCLPMIIKTVFATKRGLENFGIFLTSNRLLYWLQC